jgi:hypothetical protein
MINRSLFIFFFITVATANVALCQKLAPIYNSALKVHISLPASGWDHFSNDSLKGNIYGISSTIVGATPANGKKYKCEIGVALIIPFDSKETIGRFKRDWDNCGDSEINNQHFYTSKGEMVNDTVKSLVTKYICDNIHGRIKKPDREKIEFLFTHNGQSYLLDCNTTTHKFNKYRKLFYRIAQSVYFD